MISYLDEQVGELVATLKELNQYENTLIIFTSDNGPTYTGGADTEYFESAAPFITAKNRGKGYVYEGGIRVPMIAAWPAQIKAGSSTAHISGFYDVLPTFCDLTNQAIPPQTDGLSFLPTLLGQEQNAHAFLYWEFPEYNGQQALRMGHWKAVRQNLKDGQIATELYHLEKDPQEQINVADQHPKVVQKIEEIFKAEHQAAKIDRFKMAALGDEITQ